jgi:hypothetical protein
VFSENAESTAVGNLPTGFTQTSDDPAYDWKVVNNESYSAPNSIYAPGGQDLNSSILTAPVWTGIMADYELRFQHKFAFEVGDYGENYDGAVLEISIPLSPTFPEIYQLLIRFRGMLRREATFLLWRARRRFFPLNRQYRYPSLR